MSKGELTAVILAGTCGARLYPLTTAKDELENYEELDNEMEDTLIDSKEESKREHSKKSYIPKHLLPLVGRPLLHHLLEHCEAVGMERIVITVGADDDVTKESLLTLGCAIIKEKETTNDKLVDDPALNPSGSTDNGVVADMPETSITKVHMKLRGSDICLLTLSVECAGSADALRYAIAANVIPDENHVMVLPADLILYGQLAVSQDEDSSFGFDALGSLADVHRREYRTGISRGMPLAMSMLLSDVGEEDENGIPLKESAKAKKGGIAREDEDIEYIGISTIQNKNRPPTQRIVLKQSKYKVEEDEDNTGSTPKLHIPKARIHCPMNQIMIKTSWSDLHVFCFSPWVLQLLEVKSFMKELGKEFVPFLISRQFRGMKASFGVNAEGKNKKESDGLMEMVIQTLSGLKLTGEPGSGSSHFVDDDLNDSDLGAESDYPFLVSANILSRDSSKFMLRACTIPSYTYACREVLSQAIASSKVMDEKKKVEMKYETDVLYLPSGASINVKFNSVTLPGADVGEKVQVKASTIGRNVKIGNRCRLNNVVVHDNVTIGENCVLQNSILSEGSTVGNNCNLNDCQIGSKANVSSGTKAKGEGF